MDGVTVLTPDNVALWLVNYKRRDALTSTIRGWFDSFPFTEANVISNHPQDYSFLDEWPVKIWPNVFRQPWATGAIAWCWNAAMLHTFETRDWCIMSQDDVTVKPGWPDLITDDYWTYVAPHGDVVQIQSLKGFNKVGWFDERFRAIGGPEADYLLRMMQEYPDRLSVHDEHVWYLYHNDVGLGELLKNSDRSGEVLYTRQRHNEQFAQKECFERWIEKWGVHVDDLFIRKLYDTPRRPGWEEIDWYPYFTRRLEEIGRR